MQRIMFVYFEVQKQCSNYICIKIIKKLRKKYSEK